MGRLMMRASSPEDEEIERPDFCIYRLPVSPPTTTEFKICSLTERSNTKDSPHPQAPTSSSMPSTSEVPSSTTSNHVCAPLQRSRSSTPKPSSSPRPFRINKRQYRPRHSRPTMRVHARFTNDNVEKARTLARSIEDEIEHTRSMDLRLGVERSMGYWLYQRTMEPKPSEMLRRLRRMQYEGAKRELVAKGLQKWEMSSVCLEGASALRMEVKAEDVEMEVE